MLINWIEDNNIRTAEYWNDFEKEKTKVFNILDGDFEKLEENSHLNDIYKHLLEISKNQNVNWREKSVLSLASGTCWLEGRFLKDKNINKLTAVDFSKHRIHELGSKTLEYYGFKEDNVDLVYGSILDIKIENKSQDIILLSQAFHHINEPIRLLDEIKRVLKKDGVVIIVGEHYYNMKIKLKQALKHFIKYLINHKEYREVNTFCPQYQAMFPPSYEKGDIHYSKLDYHNMFKGMGFTYSHYIDKTKTIQAFILRHNESN